MVMPAALAQTLELIGQATIGARDDWWLIGSAAVVLHGGDIPQVKDVDVVMSARDADEFLLKVGTQRGGAKPSDRFHSSVFGIWKMPPVAVEVFGGFKLRSKGGWREVCFSTRVPVNVGATTVYVPSKEELIALLRSFGRKKDLERANFLGA